VLSSEVEYSVSLGRLLPPSPPLTQHRGFSITSRHAANRALPGLTLQPGPLLFPTFVWDGCVSFSFPRLSWLREYSFKLLFANCNETLIISFPCQTDQFAKQKSWSFTNSYQRGLLLIWINFFPPPFNYTYDPMQEYTFLKPISFLETPEEEVGTF